jgi:RNA polymerase sigma factor (sigma-70 family)
MPVYPNITIDQKLLWKQFKQGCKESFNTIIKAYYQEMYSYGSCFTKDTGLLNDSIQDVFLVLWKNRADLGDTSQVNLYLLKSLRRKLFENIKTSRRYSLISENSFSELWDFQLNKENAIVHEEELQEIIVELRHAVSKLTKRQQEIIYLRFYNNASTQEIADTMGLSPQAVYNLLHHAIKRLKEICTKPNTSAGFKDQRLLILFALLSGSI